MNFFSSRLTPLFKEQPVIDGLSLALVVNRLQMVFLLLFSPTIFVYPHLIWFLLLFGVLSLLNLRIISGWLNTKRGQQGYKGVADLFGTVLSKFLFFVAIIIIFIKFSILSSEYIHLLNQFLFREQSETVLTILLISTAVYLASQGIGHTLKFVVFVFISSFWILFVFTYVVFLSLDHWSNLYPIFSTKLPEDSYISLIKLWALYSGPEYLVVLAPWIRPGVNILRRTSAGNVISVLEYVVLLAVVSIFFGRDYLQLLEQPLVNIIRYVQLPFIERIDMIVIPALAVIFIFNLALLLLLGYGAFTWLSNLDKDGTNASLFASFSLFFILSVMLFHTWFWGNEADRQFGLNVLLVISATGYTFLPTFLFVVNWWKEKKSH